MSACLFRVTVESLTVISILTFGSPSLDAASLADFGARGDGKTNDTAALKEAFASGKNLRDCSECNRPVLSRRSARTPPRFYEWHPNEAPFLTGFPTLCFFPGAPWRSRW